MMENSLVSASVTVHIQCVGGEATTKVYNVICTPREFKESSFEQMFLLDGNYLEIPFIALGTAQPGIAIVSEDSSAICTISTYTDDDVKTSYTNVETGVTVIPVPVPTKLPAMVALSCGKRTAYLTFLSAMQSHNRLIIRWRNSFNVPVIDSFPAKITQNPAKLYTTVRIGNMLHRAGVSEYPDYTTEISELTFDRAVALSKLVEAEEVEIIEVDPVRFSTNVVDMPLTYKARKIVIKNIESNISDSRSEKSSVKITFEYA